MRADDEFLKVAVHSGLLDQVVADELHTLADHRGVPTARAALDAGKLNHDQVDVIEALRRPRDHVPGFELLSLLGQGGMGVVFRARQLAFDRVVALKMVRTGPATTGSLARFEQEAKTIGRFSHPHIVTAFDFGKHEGRLYLAMEFLDGQDAERYASTSEFLPERVVWGLIRQAATGLMYAAERGVTHRDIKPANLLLVKPPSGYPLGEGIPFVKIADFGLALLQEEVDQQTRLTQENSTVGSPHYMAPEQLTGSNVGFRADIYALGATAYHLLCGKPPFAGFTLAQLYSRKLNGDPPPLALLRPGLSAESIALVNSMMQREPEKRPADYSELLRQIDAIQHAGAPTTVNTRPSGSTAISESVVVAGTPSRAKLRWIWMISAAVLAALALLAATQTVMKLVAGPSAGPRNWVLTGWAQECFDGQSLSGWRTVRGSWTPGQQDAEGALILAGRGAIGHPVAKPVNGQLQPLKGFRLATVGHLHSAQSLEIHFTDDLPARAGSSRQLVYQLTTDAVRWGSRQRQSGPLETIFGEHQITVAPESRHELRIEYQGGEWLAYFDGELFGTHRGDGPDPLEFRLAAEVPTGDDTATAWFGDVILEELGPPN